MKRFILSLLVPVLIITVGMSQAHADSITTIFAANNGGASGGAVYFDLTVGANPLSITGFDTNTTQTDPFNDFQVWVLEGITSQGNETGGSWVQVATGSGTGAGSNNPTAVALASPFVVDANTLYGVALVAGSTMGHRYTNGDGSNQNYSNADLALAMGSATNTPFTGTIFTPRVWNGTIYYDVQSAPVPEPGTMLLLGSGLAGLGWYRRRRKKLA